MAGIYKSKWKERGIMTQGFTVCTKQRGKMREVPPATLLMFTCVQFFSSADV